MEPCNFCLRLLVFILLAFVASIGTKRVKRRCFLERSKTFSCRRDQFTCLNGNCIQRKEYCDGRNQCGDNSDETYCRGHYRDSAIDVIFTECKHTNRYIPKAWVCDGVIDCPFDAYDESEGPCGSKLFGKQKSFKWMYDRTFNESTGIKWNAFIHKAAVALFLAESFPELPCFHQIIAKDVSIEFLSRLSQKKLSDVSTADLAAFVNAMLVTCLNPRQFYGINLIEEIRYRVNNQNYTNPYILLTLCNAGDTITEEDKKKLSETFWGNHRQFWTDIQAMVVMALSCAAKQPNNNIDEEMMKEFTDELKKHQYRNGSVGNIQTTALVLQALYAAEPDEDPDHFDEKKALDQIMATLDPEGSFGNFMKTYYVLPVLNCRSLVNITAEHCKYAQRDENSALQGLENRVGPKKRVQYSLWFGDQKYMERTISLKVPANMSFYGVMEVAAETDERYRFEYLVKNRKPYVDEISGLQDDPEIGKFWFLYIIQDGETSPILKSPADVIPKDNDHFVMWYRSGSWID